VACASMHLVTFNFFDGRAACLCARVCVSASAFVTMRRALVPAHETAGQCLQCVAGAPAARRGPAVLAGLWVVSCLFVRCCRSHPRFPLSAPALAWQAQPARPRSFLVAVLASGRWYARACAMKARARAAPTLLQGGGATGRCCDETPSACAPLLHTHATPAPQAQGSSTWSLVLWTSRPPAPVRSPPPCFCI
jgi:hypothetical protein